MRKVLLFLLVVGFGTGLVGITIGEMRFSKFQENIFRLVAEARSVGIQKEKWASIAESARKLPPIFPISGIRNALLEASEIVEELETLKNVLPRISDDSLQVSDMNLLFEKLKVFQTKLKRIERNLDFIPDIFLSTSQEEEIQIEVRKIRLVRSVLDDVEKFQGVFQKFSKREESVLVILQNQNEPRSTGGFGGSFLFIDFGKEKISWHFEDVYALDKFVPEKEQIAAPEFFHDLSKTISLRDANFWPDFPTSARAYIDFLESLEKEKKVQHIPKTILAINLNFAKAMLHLTGPVSLRKWGITTTEANIELVLQFLVESKIAGRFNVKLPVLEFMKELFAPETLKKITAESLAQFDWENFIAQKNILGYSENSELERLFEKWSVDGALRQKSDADNFLYFDFISVGANKSEKFMWTKIWHDSEIQKDGTVKNSLEITRTHSLREGEMDELLETNLWFPNVRDLLNEEIFWKLGKGQNRTMIRVFIPADAQLMQAKNPSGRVSEVLSDDKKFQILEVPLFVGPGETGKTEIIYETKMGKGSFNWRPYFLQVVGTPGREKTSFLSTVSTEAGGTFRAETMNIGKPEDLMDNDFRSVIEFIQ